MDKLYTTTQAAAYLGIRRQWVWRLISAGRLAAKPFGRDYAITQAALDSYQLARRPAGRPKTSEKPLKKQGKEKIQKIR